MEDSDTPREVRAARRPAFWLGQGALAAFCLWSADAVFSCVVYGHLSARALSGALAIGFLLASFLGLILGLGAAIIHRLLGGDGEPVERHLGRWLTPSSRAERFGRVGTLLSLTTLALLFTLGVGLTSHRIALEVVRPHFVALGVALTSLLWVFVLALLFRPLRRRFRQLAEASASRLLVGGILGSPSRVLLCLALIAVASSAGVLAGYWSVFRYLPWPTVLRLAGAAVAYLALRVLSRRLSPRASRPLVSLAILVALVATVVALGVPDHARSTRRVGYEEMLVGRGAMSLLRPAFDFDGDGHVAMLGEGDCAPFDGSIHPGAVERPANDVDEDCDGIDLDATHRLTAGRYDLPIPDEMPPRPDILLVTIDAFSPRHMRALGYPHEVTPYLDRLAEESVFFTSAFAGGPSTRLSFPSLFTSRWDSEIPRTQSRRKPHPLACRGCQVAEILRSAGYATEAVVPDVYFTPGRWESIGNGFDHVNSRAIRAGHKNAAAVTREALSVLAERQSETPLFMWVHYYDAHSPHEAIEAEPARGEALVDLYDAELRQIDREVEPLIEAMRSHDPDSLVVVTSDHALVFGHPRPAMRRARYGFDLYSATLHVPLIFSAPYLRPGRHEGTVTLLDVLPTLANLLRIPPGRVFRGTSLVPQLLGREPSRGRLHFHEFWLSEAHFRGRDPLKLVSVRDERFNFVIDRRTGMEQLFDYRSDYYELSNLLDAEEAPAEAAPLRAALQHFVATQTPSGSDTVAP